MRTCVLIKMRFSEKKVLIKIYFVRGGGGWWMWSRRPDALHVPYSNPNWEGKKQKNSTCKRTMLLFDTIYGILFYSFIHLSDVVNTRGVGGGGRTTLNFSWWRRKYSRIVCRRQIQFPIDSNSYYVWFIDRQTFASAQTDSQMYTTTITLSPNGSHIHDMMESSPSPLMMGTRFRPINYSQQSFCCSSIQFTKSSCRSCMYSSTHSIHLFSHNLIILF